MKIVNTLRVRYSLFRKWLKYIHYKRMYGAILQRKRKKEKIRILFFVMSVDMWKSNGLFTLLLNDPRFEPYIIPQLLQQNNEEQNERIQSTLKEYFESLGFPFLEAINMKTGEVFDVNQFDTDIVFCSQPYDCGLNEHRINSIWNNVLFAYIPYCVNIELNPILYTGLYQNICWKYYCSFRLNKQYESSLLFNKGKNIVVAGHPLFEQIENNRGREVCQWKDKHHKKIRLIWAPHHSILPTDVLGYSNFLEIADLMMNLALSYRDVIEIAFKPHPILKEKLYYLKEWGIERTEKYYVFWRDSSNTILSEGVYSDLFMTSDAMVHDSSSFICEYLYTTKPVMFLSKEHNRIRQGLNDLGKSCFDLHYKGSSISDIEYFINEIVVRGNDSMLEAREFFYKQELKINSTMLVNEYIYNDIKSTLLNK